MCWYHLLGSIISYSISRVNAAYQRHQSQQPGGGPTGVNGALTADGGLVPASLAAVTAQTWLTPLVSPETVMGEVGLAPKINVSPKQ